VIRREQYPIRTPLDDPTVLHGPGNPGRDLTILGYQLANYAQYFDWQWARTLGDGPFTTVSRLAVTMVMALLGLRGLASQWRANRGGFWFLLAAFGVTGLGLVLYMNFKPGPSIGYGRWPTVTDHEVRERDYFFVASFVAWGVAVALGLAVTARRLVASERWRRFAPAVLLVALVPPLANAGEASRRHGPDTTMARDFARALLNSVPPGGILFTWGDNDTFPLWHAQLVDGIRPDVTVVCLALAETSWYQRQIREWRPGAIDPAALPAPWRGQPVPAVDGPLHTLDDSMIDGFRPQLAGEDYELPLPMGGALHFPRGTPLYAKDMLLIAVVRQNAGRRPIAWAITAAQKTFGAPVIQQGLALVLPTSYPDSATALATLVGGGGEPPIDVPATRVLAEETWDFGALMTEDLTDLEANAAAMARTVALPHAQLGIGLLQLGDTTGAIRHLERAVHLAPAEQSLRQFLTEVRGPTAPFPVAPPTN
jgi:hypothetical protein